MSQAKDSECIRRALAGDQEAFEALYRAYLPRVQATILRRTADRDTAEDLVQITFMRAFHALRSFRGDAAFSTWLTQIALNVCLSHFRSQQTRLTWVQSLEDPESASAIDRKPALHENPEEAMHRKQRQELVKRGIRSLPVRYRRAMWLHYVRERSYEEITQALHVPMGTVKTWLCRARRQLKGEFRKLGLQPL